MQRNYEAGHVMPVRNPWMDSSSSSASRGSFRRQRDGPRTHTIRPVQNAGPPPVSDWLRPPQCHHRVDGPQLNMPQHTASPSIGSSPTESAGGHVSAGSASGCAKCDSFCYHCLQVVYIAGILTGVSLVIAGSVLRGSPRRGDLVVLVYIGVLVAAVCSLLLSVHYCVRRGVKDRKRAARGPRLPVHAACDATELHQLNQPHPQPRPTVHPHDFTDVRIQPDFDEIRPCPVDSRHNLNDFRSHAEPRLQTDVRGYPGDFGYPGNVGYSRQQSDEVGVVRDYPSDSRPHQGTIAYSRQHSDDFGAVRGHPSDIRAPSGNIGYSRQRSDDLVPNHGYPSDFRHDLGDVRRSSRSRSSHSSHGRRYYLYDEEKPEEWERQPYQPLLHRPR